MIVRESNYNYENSNQVQVLQTAKTLLLSYILHGLLISVIIIDIFGVKISYFRSILAFIYLAFIPGLLLIRLVGVYGSRLEDILYSIGVSQGLLMFVGFIINVSSPIFRIRTPISENFLIVTTICITLCLTFILHIYRKISLNILIKILLLNKKNNKSLIKLIEFMDRQNNIIYLFLLLPFLSISGANLLTYYNNNSLLVTLIILICVAQFLAVTKLQARYYPLAIWLVALSLLFSTSLIGNELPWDIPKEWWVGQYVILNGFWDSSIGPYYTKNSLLRLAILNPIYSIICDIPLKMVFKIIHPILYSLTPVALYLSFRRYFGDKYALVASYLFIANFAFYVLFSTNTREGGAELILSLIILLISDRDLNYFQKSFLGIMFAFSLVNSHYGVSYLFMFSVLFIGFFLIINKIKHIIDFRPTLITLNFTILYLSMVISWYIYNANSVTYDTLVDFCYHVIKMLVKLGSPEYSYSIFVLHKPWKSVTLNILKYINLIIIFFISLGVFVVVLNIISKKKTCPVKYYLDYELVLLIVSFFIFLMATMLPGAIKYNTARIFQTSLLFLAPMAIVGYCTLIWILKNVIYKIIKIFKFNHTIKSRVNYYKENKFIIISFTIFILIYFTLNSGLTSALFSDYSPNVLISKDRIIEKGYSDIDEEIYFYKQFRVVYDIYGSRWLLIHMDRRLQLYSSEWPGDPPFYTFSLEDIKYRDFSMLLQTVERRNKYEGYVYLSYLSHVEGIIVDINYHKYELPKYEINFTKIIDPIISYWNKIYDNGGNLIYIKEK